MSPALNSGNFLPVANASSATLIKSIFCIKLKIVCRSNATWTWTTLLPRQQRLRRKAGAKLLLFLVSRKFSVTFFTFSLCFFIFKNFNSKSNNIEGVWKDISSNKELKITLTKSFDIDFGDSIEWKNKELLHPTSLKDKYFKLIISKEKNRFYASVTGLKIFEKKTDKLIQQIDLECQLWGLDNISIDDYNFDGISDFSVFEQSYAGPNTSRLYFLYNPKTKKYFESDFGGISLEFNSKTKRIFERNQCCAGSIVTTAEYKVIDNKMVLIKEHCFKWDEKKQKLVERKMKDCQ